MKQRAIHTQEELDKAADDLRKLGENLPFVITVSEGRKSRSLSQNAAYWASLNELIAQIRNAVEQISEHTGYTPIEVKRLISCCLESEYAAILYARKAEVVHDILKEICDIPTTTRAGSKEFKKFSERMEQAMAIVEGAVNHVSMKALS